MTVLTAVMIAGLLTIVALLVIRLSAPASPPLPDQITLPDGVTARAITQGTGWFAVVTDQDEILIFNTDGSLRQRVEITK